MFFKYSLVFCFWVAVNQTAVVHDRLEHSFISRLVKTVLVASCFTQISPILMKASFLFASLVASHLVARYRLARMYLDNLG